MMRTAPVLGLLLAAVFAAAPSFGDESPVPPPSAPAVPAGPSVPAAPAPSGPATPAGPAAPAAPLAEATGPRIEVERRSVDLGVARQNEEKKITIRVTNTGVKPLHLTVRGECSCVQITVSKKTLEPGESGTLEIVFRTYTFVGPMTKHVTVSSDDPDHPTVTIEVKVDVSAGLVLAPANFFFNSVLVGASPTATVKVMKKVTPEAATGSGPGFRVLETTAKGTGVEKVEFTASPFVEGAWRGYEVTLRFREPPPVGPVSGEAFVRTDDPDAPSLRCLVGGMVSSKVFLALRVVSFGQTVAGQEVVRRVSCRGFDDTIALGEVTARAAKGVVTARAVRDPNDPKGWIVEITLPKTTPVGDLKGADTVIVTTAVPGEERTEIAIEGAVVPAAPK